MKIFFNHQSFWPATPLKGGFETSRLGVSTIHVVVNLM